MLAGSQENVRSRQFMKWDRLALILLLLTCAVVLLFPYIRSAWFMGRSDDTLMSIGFLRSKLLTGFECSPYPPITNISASLVLIANMGIFEANAMIGPVFCLLGILFTYCLAKNIFKNNQTLALAVASSGIFLIRMPTAKPFYISIVLLPLALALFLSFNKNLSYRITSILYFLLLAFVHPVTSGALIIGIFGIELFKKLLSYFHQRQVASNNFKFLIFFIIAFISWIIYNLFFFLISPIRRAKAFFTTGIEMLPSNEPIYQSSQYGIGYFDLIVIIFKSYGVQFIFLLLTAIVIFIIYRKMLSKSINRDECRLAIISGWLFATGSITLLSFILIELIPTNAIRFINLPLVITPLFAAYFLFMLNSIIKEKIIKLNGIEIKPWITIHSLHMLPSLSILGIAFALMLFSIYPSPYTSVMSQQVMKSEIIGSEWILGHTDINSRIGNLDERILEIAPVSWHRKLPKQIFLSVPLDIAYNKVSSLQDFDETCDYLVITQARIVRVTESSLPKDLFVTEENLRQFEFDKSVNEIYSNQDYFAFYISPKE